MWTRLSRGGVKHYHDAIAQLPTLKKRVAESQSLYDHILSAETEERKQILGAQLVKSLQVIGYYLDDADHGKLPRRYLNPAQVEEQSQLDREFAEIEIPYDREEVRMVTPRIYYTIKNVPVVLSFRAPVGTEIILSSELGGMFPNQLSKVKIVANDEGVAETYWYSNGEGVGGCQVLYRSAAHHETGEVNIEVKKLHLLDFEALSTVDHQALKHSDVPQNQATTTATQLSTTAED